MRRGTIIIILLLLLVSSGCIEELGYRAKPVKKLYACPTGESVSDPKLCPKITTVPPTTTPIPIQLSTTTPAPTTILYLTTPAPTTAPPTTTLPPTPTPPSLEIIEHSFSADPNGRGLLTGKIKNNAETTFTNVQIEGIFYNKDLLIVETKKTYPIGEIESKESKDFKVLTEKLITYTDYYEIVIHTTGESPIQTTVPPLTTKPPPTYQPPSTTDTPISILAPLDSDGDRVADTADQCPFIYGRIAFKGCLTPPTLPTTPKSTPSNEYIPREYRWTFKGRDYTWNPQFSENLYNYYKNKPRPSTSDYSVYATDPYDDELISEIISKFKADSEKYGFNKFDTVNYVVKFVQSLPYTSDDVTTPYDEYPRYPIETLVDNGGDCEDTAILAGALISELDYGVVLLDLPGHMAVGIRCNEISGASYYRDEYGNK